MSKSAEWTAKPSQTHGWYIEFDRGNGASIDNELTAKGIANAHNAALADQQEEFKQFYQDESEAEWALWPVVKSNGELWLGLATISYGERKLATINAEEAKALLKAINAALAAEREKVKELQGWKDSQMAVEATWDCQAVGRELGITLGQLIHPNILPVIQQLRKELDEAREVLLNLSSYGVAKADSFLTNTCDAFLAKTRGKK